ncbi:Putative phosphoglycerate dehydrogenase [Elusimicrobium minutum Pei191]|uniref:Putative phosphoglycerate dehydrogenase n=1 Tax=Elusimicrobium minutum (strain Pei191) TaxID=445932 RepID=B2KCL9_ELUMP|nr:3-phosphoglycerate dehydrogenase [Elusimicrobium minutum]ACC98265.1 Putative phosphoglycerate dehydrogenase [Elusimicrobium minutum Pei191]
MKILIADKFPKHWVEVLKEKGHEIILNPALDENTLPEAQKTEQAEIIIVRSTKVNASAIDAAPSLKLVIRAGAGYDTIDINHAKTKGVAVCNCPGTNSIAVAELAMGLILSLDRRIPDNIIDLKAGKWNKTEYSKAKGLYGRTLGIIGLGHIGREVAKRAQAFGLKIIAFDPFVKESPLAQMVSDVYDLAKKADIITIHVPNTAGTKHFYDEKFFEAMKPGAYFINTSRGGLVKEDALIKACAEKGIRAALDVYEKEPKADAKEFVDPVTSAVNIYGTHHIGASTEQAQDAVAEVAVQIVQELADKGTFLHQVNK